MLKFIFIVIIIGRLAKGTMGEGLQAGANVQRKLAKDWNDLGAAAKAIQG
ncbi:hypothetical protein HB958_14255, partial [Listeria welshimeri]|nr:hypothetical protein [Listeria welshimeri]MBC1659867.1 hypothetical protein [Listeria welshimeri]